jgi:hypothetical protein
MDLHLCAEMNFSMIDKGTGSRNFSIIKETEKPWLTTCPIDLVSKDGIKHSSYIVTHSDLYTERYHLPCWTHKKSLYEETVVTTATQSTWLEDVFYHGLAFRRSYKSLICPLPRSETCIISRITNLFLRWLRIESLAGRKFLPHHSWSMTVYSVLKLETKLASGSSNFFLSLWAELETKNLSIGPYWVWYFPGSYTWWWKHIRLLRRRLIWI